MLVQYKMDFLSVKPTMVGKNLPNVRDIQEQSKFTWHLVGVRERCYTKLSFSPLPTLRLYVLIKK